MPFLPFIIGYRVLHSDQTWKLVLELKDLVDNSLFLFRLTLFTSTNIGPQTFVADSFSGKKLCPKHHFIEHYPYLIKNLGPPTEYWTIRFEAKHFFFKKVVRDANNFKNILLTLASRHQLMLAHYLSMPSIFKLEIEAAKVCDMCVQVLDVVLRQAILKRFSNVETVGLTPHIILNGIKYSKGMILSAGSTSRLPDFLNILEICILLTSHVCFIVEP